MNRIISESNLILLESAKHAKQPGPDTKVYAIKNDLNRNKRLRFILNRLMGQFGVRKNFVSPSMPPGPRVSGVKGTLNPISIV